MDRNKLILKAMMCDKPNCELMTLNTDQGYYLQVEFFKNNGKSKLN